MTTLGVLLGLLLVFPSILWNPVVNAQSCPEGAKFSKCTTICESHCLPSNVHCTEECRPGCVCEESGYRIKGDRCVPKSECDVCPPETDNSGCGCVNYCLPPGARCTRDCIKSCKCMKSEHAIYGDRCVPKSECPKPQSCPEGAEFSECTWSCGSQCLPSNVICDKRCRPGCVCKESGYLIKGDRCVLPEECDICPPEAEKSDSGCEGYCLPPGAYCGGGPAPGCKCLKSGYIIKGDRCVPQSECPPKE